MSRRPSTPPPPKGLPDERTARTLHYRLVQMPSAAANALHERTATSPWAEPRQRATRPRVPTAGSHTGAAALITLKVMHRWVSRSPALVAPVRVADTGQQERTVVEKPNNGKAIRGSARSDALATPKTQAPGVGSGRRAGIPNERRRLIRDCAHQQSHHEHGTRKAYVLDRCRCEPCTAANRFEAQRRRKAIAYGRWQGLVPAGAAREHVQQLRSVGISLQRIATSSGVGYGTVARLAYGNASSRQPPTERLRHDTEQRLLKMRAGAGTVPPGARVEATGSRRRLQALVAAGWPLPTLAQRLAEAPETFAAR